MNFEDILIRPNVIKTEDWQLGTFISQNLVEDSLVFIFVSDNRGARGDADQQDFSNIRREFYRLSTLDFQVPMVDLGDLISGKTTEDTHYILQEMLSTCQQKRAIPVVVGGSTDLAFSLYCALDNFHKTINYTQINNVVSLLQGDPINEKNFLSKILTSNNFEVKNYHHLGYQKHLNEMDSVKLIKEVQFDIVRLADMMNTTEKTEPYFRKADLVTVNCDAVESGADPFSINPQVNGLNKREICAYMKEIGLSENLKSVGIFNYNIYSDDRMNHQLLAQMLWYMTEGINIQRTHPQQRKFETYWVMHGDESVAFQRDTFRNLWYFGESEDVNDLIPCSRVDFEEAKRGFLGERFTRQ